MFPNLSYRRGRGGGSLKSLVRLPGRIIKEGSQLAAPFAISLPPSCLQCNCEGRSSGSCLVTMRASLTACGGVHSWRKAGFLITWWHVYPVPHWSLLDVTWDKKKSSLGLSRISNKTQSDVRWPFFPSPKGLPCHVHCKTTVFGTNFLDLKHQYLVSNSSPQPIIMDL